MIESKTPQVERQERELRALTEVAKTLTAALPLSALLGAIMDRIIGVLEPAEIGAIMIWDPDSGVLRAQAAFGYDLEILKQVGLRSGEAITGKVHEQGSVLLLDNPNKVDEEMADLRTANRELLAKSLKTGALPICTAAAPITNGEQKYGVLILETIAGPDIFTVDDLPFIQTLADLIALAIERARLTAKADSVRQQREREHLESEMLATLSHELRMPLTAIKGYASALLLEELNWSPEKQTEFLELIDQECDNMQVLLADIIDTAIVDIHQIPVEPQPIRLGKLAREVAEEMQRLSHSHTLMVDFPPGFPIIQVDPHRIRQVLRNLLDNAIKYSPEGGLIVIQGEVRKDDIAVHIADQGIGIPAEELIPLFEKYRRIRTKDLPGIPGMGLGLPIARTLVEAHGGKIWAESKPSQGTILSFSLPIPRDVKNPGANDLIMKASQGE